MCWYDGDKAMRTGPFGLREVAVRQEHARCGGDRQEQPHLHVGTTPDQLNEACDRDKPDERWRHHWFPELPHAVEAELTQHVDAGSGILDVQPIVADDADEERRCDN